MELPGTDQDVCEARCEDHVRPDNPRTVMVCGAFHLVGFRDDVGV